MRTSCRLHGLSRSLVFVLVAATVSLPLIPTRGADYPPMPAPGEKVPIGDGHYLVYGFDSAPKLGTAIMRVEIFSREGIRDTSLRVKADAGMPSMRGAHEMGERAFQLSRKGVYLLPIPIVMPGEWEVRFTVSRGEAVIFRGGYTFDV